MTLWDLPEPDDPVIDEVAPPDPDSRPTFLPHTLAVHDCPLTQYVPFASLNPEEQAAAATMFRELPPPAQAYLLAFIETWDPTLARQRSGGRTYGVSAPAVVQRTRQLIALLRQADQRFAAKQAGITRERYLQELNAIAFFDPGTLYDPETGDARPVHTLPAATRRALLIMQKTGGKHGDEARVTPHEKLPALRMVGATLGYDAPAHNVIPKVRPVRVLFVEAQAVPDEPEEEAPTHVPVVDDGGGALSRHISYPLRPPSV